MKKIQIFQLLLCLVLFSCNNQKEKQVATSTQETPKIEKSLPKTDFNKLIVGKWKPLFEETAARLSEEGKMKIGTGLEAFRETFEGMNYEFKEDGKYIYNIGTAPQEANTVWKINENTLEILEGEQVYFSYEILELTDDRMLLRSNSDDGEIFPEIVYKKVR